MLVISPHDISDIRSVNLLDYKVTPFTSPLNSLTQDNS